MAFWNRSKRTIVDEAVLELIRLHPHTTGQLVNILEIPNYQVKAAARRLQRSGNIKEVARGRDGQRTYAPTISP